VTDLVKTSFVIFDIQALWWRSALGNCDVDSWYYYVVSCCRRRLSEPRRDIHLSM